jgi:hypothetical protein
MLTLLGVLAAMLAVAGAVDAASISRGSFVALNNERASGLATLVRLKSDKVVLRVTKSDIKPGPALHVYLVAGTVKADRDVKRFVDLGPLKATSGTHSYVVPRKVDTTRFRTVVIWCADFSVAFGKAVLKPT